MAHAYGIFVISEQECQESRINDAHALVHHLPAENIRMLKILVQHLCKQVFTSLFIFLISIIAIFNTQN